MWWVISKDNFGGEGPGSDDKIIAVLYHRDNAENICYILNVDDPHKNRSRYYFVVPEGTKLQKFEP